MFMSKFETQQATRGPVAITETNRWIVLDLESGFDPEGHANFQQSEGYNPHEPTNLIMRKEWVEPRFVFRPGVAVSWLVIERDQDKLFAVRQFRTFGLPEHTMGDALEVLAGDLVLGGKLATWGGENCDLPRLRMSILNAGRALPATLSRYVDVNARLTGCHVDLWWHLCGRGGNIHLNEMAAAMRLPAKPMGRPANGAAAIAKGRWAEVKSVCEADVLTTALTLVRHLHAALGEPSLGSCLRIADLGRTRVHRAYADVFAQYHLHLMTDAFAAAEQQAKIFAS